MILTFTVLICSSLRSNILEMNAWYSDRKNTCQNLLYKFIDHLIDYVSDYHLRYKITKDQWGSFDPD